MRSSSFIATAISALKRHRVVLGLTFSATILGSILYLLVTPPVYKSSARIMLEEGEETVSDLGRALTKLEGPGSTSDPLATQSELIASQAVLDRARQKLMGRYPELPLTVDELEEQVEVRIIPATNILELSFSYGDPQVAANVLDAVVESTAEVNGEAIREEASLVRQFLEEQLPKKEAELTYAEAAESRFRQVNGIVSLEDQVSTLVDNLSQLENEERQLAAQLQEMQERVRLLRQVTGVDAVESAYSSVLVGQDQTVNGLRNQLSELESQIVESGSRLGEQHPELQALLEQRQGLQQLYQSQIREIARGQESSASSLALQPLSQDLIAQYITDGITYRSLSKRLTTVQTERAALDTRLTEIPVLSRPLASLIRQRQAAEEALQNLRRNLEEARIAEAQLVSNIRPLGNARIPSNPSEPNLFMVLILGVVAGIFLAAFELILLEGLEYSSDSSEEEARTLQGQKTHQASETTVT
ncbi:hypothetical protein C7271_00685 [filamentous cyanobacterium CCP5]|nr:hypothetical protein C7271_00685 [filamentous cyanobacterium CCP5]